MNMKMTGLTTLVYIAVPLAILLAVFSLILFFTDDRGDQEQEVPTVGSLYKSTDGGVTWKVLGEFPGGDISTMDFDSSDDNILMIGTRARGVWRGSGDGDEWNQYPGGVGESAHIFDLIEPIDEARFTALVNFTDRGRIIVFEDGFRRELFFTPLERFAFLAGYKTASGAFRVIGSDGGFYESLNDGRTWRSKSRFNRGLLLMATDNVREDTIWVIDPDGNLYRSINGGNSWTDLSAGLREFDQTSEVNFLFFDPGSGILYHGSSAGLVRSFDEGINWDRVDLTVAPETLPVTAMAVDPRNSSKLFVATANQIYISEDGGINWRQVNSPAPRGVITRILVDPDNGRELFMGYRGI